VYNELERTNECARRYVEKKEIKNIHSSCRCNRARVRKWTWHGGISEITVGGSMD
jgi:hypothetical protein